MKIKLPRQVLSLLLPCLLLVGCASGGPAKQQDQDGYYIVRPEITAPAGQPGYPPVWRKRGDPSGTEYIRTLSGLFLRY